jgi:tRNA(fMet)-specific endonuclease VapC
MDLALLDTDILSELLKGINPAVVQRGAAYVAQYGQVAFSSGTRYQIFRGLKEKKAVSQLAKFHTLCSHSLVLSVTDGIFDRASDLWAEARSKGYPHEDIDLIIAATALDAGRVLVTGNLSHFAWISGLRTDNWRQP